MVDAPTGADEIRVDRAYVRDRLGAWGADHTFTLDSGRIVAAAEDVTFTTFRPNATPTYTLGSHESIRFAERPMWLSVDHDDDGPITVTADAEDTTGQPVEVDVEWLWAQGLIAPQAVHEDGSQIPVAWVEGGWTYRVDVPHFSAFELCNSFFTTDTGDDCGSYEDVSVELDVKVRIDGVVTDHDGQELWDAKNRTLHVEVDDHLTEVDVLVERAWVDDHIDRLAVWRRNVTAETVDGTPYYVSSFPSDETPTDHVLREYQAANRTMFTAGNRSLIDAPMGMYLNVSARPGNVTIAPQVREGVDASRVPLFVNRSTLAREWNVTDPTVYDSTGQMLPMGVTARQLRVWVNASDGAPNVHVLNDAASTVNGSSGRCRNRTAFLWGWSHDETLGASKARVYAANGAFCWEWEMWPGQNISGENLSHYQIRGEVRNQSSGASVCRFGFPARDMEKNFSFGAQSCRAREVPSHVDATLRAHAVSEPASGHRWYGATRAGLAGSSCDASDAAMVRAHDPVVTEEAPVEDLCGIDWVVDGGYAALAPDEEGYPEDQEAVITNASEAVNVTRARQPFVNVSDTEYLIADEVVAIFNGSIPDNITEIVADYGVVKVQNETLNMTVVRTYSANLTDEAISDLDSRNDTLDAHQARYYTLAAHPNDPMFEASDEQGGQVGVDHVKLPEAWHNVAEGHGNWAGYLCSPDSDSCAEPAGIAILDTGVMDGHTDLKTNMQAIESNGWCGGHANMISGKPPVDNVGHGTRVAGIAGARIDNNRYVAGSANVCLTDVKVCETATGVWRLPDNVCPSYAVALGILHAAHLKYPYNVQVISMSLGCVDNSDICRPLDGGTYRPVKMAGEIAYDTHGKLLVAAAGNEACSDTDQVRYPASWEDFVAVGALNFTGTGPARATSCGPDVELAATGQNITTIIAGMPPFCNPVVCEVTKHMYQWGYGLTRTWCGDDGCTSSATPFVSGVAALAYWYSEGDASMSEIRQALRDTADASVEDGDGQNEVGYGLIDAEATLKVFS